MRCATVLLLALLSIPAMAQTAETDQRTLQALLTEVKELRLAIERSTLLGARTQLAISRLQLQQTTANQISHELDSAREQVADISGKRVRSQEELRQLEEHMAATTNPQERSALGDAIRERKLEIEQLSAFEQQRAAREADLSRKLQNAQGDVADAEKRIADMERNLDAAIEQILKR
jgi:hypothetical protein